MGSGTSSASESIGLKNALPPYLFLRKHSGPVHYWNRRECEPRVKSKTQCRQSSGGPLYINDPRIVARFREFVAQSESN
jgi:hypothetical protein